MSEILIMQQATLLYILVGILEKSKGLKDCLSLSTKYYYCDVCTKYSTVQKKILNADLFIFIYRLIFVNINYPSDLSVSSG